MTLGENVNPEVRAFFENLPLETSSLIESVRLRPSDGSYQVWPVRFSDARTIINLINSHGWSDGIRFGVVSEL